MGPWPSDRSKPPRPNPMNPMRQAVTQSAPAREAPADVAALVLRTLDDAHIGIVVVEPLGLRAVEVNHAAAAILGREREAVLNGTSMLDCLDADDRAVVEQRLRALSSAHDFEYVEARAPR